MLRRNYGSDDVLNLLRDLSDQEDEGGASCIDTGSEFTDGEVQNDDHSDDSELLGDGDDEIVIDDDDLVLGNDLETIWCRKEFKGLFKTPRKNIVKKFPGPKPKARDVKTEIDTFLQFFDTVMLDTILTYTNYYIQTITAEKYKRERDCLPTDRTELMALIGILYLIGLRKGNHANVEEIWTNNGTGVMAVRAAMSYRHFLLLLCSMRFDNRDTRAARCSVDKFAAIRTILDPFVKNCVESYNPSELVTIDDMLHPFRGRCSFVQYMPSKPAKYGLKMFALCDAKTFYCCNLEVYCGKQPPGPNLVSNTPADIVKRLVVPIKNSNRNLTTDNWYTSIPLVEDMLAQKITMIGTLKKNKAAIPPSFQPNKQQAVGSSEFGFSDDKTLVSYVPKSNKAVILVSSMHDTKTIDLETGKSEIIIDYNMTKGGVDTCDKMCAAYSVSRVTRRWHQAIFYVLMNVASINARFLLSFINPNNIPRRKIFQKNLAMELMKGHLTTRATIKTLPKDTSVYLERYHEEAEEEASTSAEPPRKKRGTCWLCGRQKNSSASMKCDKCAKFICKNHGKKQIVCEKCIEAGETNDEF